MLPGFKSKWERRFAVAETAAFTATIIGGAIYLSVQFVELSRTIDTVARELITTNSLAAEKALDQFFQPVEHQVALVRAHGEQGFFDGIDRARFNRFFSPVFGQYPSVSSLLMGDSEGNEHMLLYAGSDRYTGRTTRGGPNGTDHVYADWMLQSDSLVLIKEYRTDVTYDPRTRPWFRVALDEQESDVAWSQPRVSWTKPYSFFTTKEPGITACGQWMDQNGVAHVVAFDVLLADLLRYLSIQRPSPEGKVFLLTGDDRWVSGGLQGTTLAEDSLLQHTMVELEELDLPLITHARMVWADQGRPANRFSFTLDNAEWHAGIIPYKVGTNEFMLGVLVPTSDIMARVNRNRNLLSVGALLLVLVTYLMYINTRRRRREFKELANRHSKVEQEQGELVDSIRYAKSLQDAVLQSSAVIKSHFSQSFVLYQPKDIVGGDMYWVDQIGRDLMFAVADCTGHGVPGALVSMVCYNALQRTIHDRESRNPGEILDIVDRRITRTFSQGSIRMQDGMDILFCRLTYRSDHGVYKGAPIADLHWSGAMQALWIIRHGSGTLEQYRGDRRSIGSANREEQYATHVADLFEGDMLYLFTDGVVDQFGGPKGRKLRSKGLQELLLRHHHAPVVDQCSAINRELSEWQGDLAQVDDRCMMAIRIDRNDLAIWETAKRQVERFED